jgi:hypothetical protein
VVSSMDAAVESVDAATIGLTFALPEYAPRRSDFILFKGPLWECTEHTHCGQEPMRDAAGLVIGCDSGVQGLLYPSDHLAVLARFQQKGCRSS